MSDDEERDLLGGDDDESESGTDKAGGAAPRLDHPR